MATKKGESQYSTNQNKYKNGEKLVFLGDSIVANFLRHDHLWIWNMYFMNALNFATGGERVEDVLCRVKYGEDIPDDTEMVIILVGTNNIHDTIPVDIANGILAIALEITKICSNVNIIICGLLPRDLKNTEVRNNINLVNKHLEYQCSYSDIRNLGYLAPDNGWIRADGSLHENLYYEDHLHLIGTGYLKLSRCIICKLKEFNKNIVVTENVSKQFV